MVFGNILGDLNTGDPMTARGDIMDPQPSPATNDTSTSERCLKSTPIGLAHLPGWTWIINERGYANTVEISTGPRPATPEGPSKTSPTSSATDATADGQPAVAPGVYGVLYRLDPSDEANLDSYEGVPYSYERQFVEAIWVEGPDAQKGQKVDVLAYVDYLRVTPGAPKLEYVARMSHLKRVRSNHAKLSTTRADNSHSPSSGTAALDIEPWGVPPPIADEVDALIVLNGDSVPTKPPPARHRCTWKLACIGTVRGRK
ncbi:Uu.00g130050.m01.CDS01 [Anthostomella pinea]|uniref:Uu.00g130050.m01.CDS01 n=1 Tax=Anthostomella pinea TaxID=933095 RepID=A0AAI8YI56_9PEZI|nr:Uu.00g130050.m01.CDS01 [Anthostomella pinea]